MYVQKDVNYNRGLGTQGQRRQTIYNRDMEYNRLHSSTLPYQSQVANLQFLQNKKELVLTKVPPSSQISYDFHVFQCFLLYIIQKNKRKTQTIGVSLQEFKILQHVINIDVTKLRIEIIVDFGEAFCMIRKGNYTLDGMLKSVGLHLLS